MWIFLNFCANCHIQCKISTFNERTAQIPIDTLKSVCTDTRTPRKSIYLAQYVNHFFLDAHPRKSRKCHRRYYPREKEKRKHFSFVYSIPICISAQIYPSLMCVYFATLQIVWNQTNFLIFLLCILGYFWFHQFAVANWFNLR